MDLIDEQDVAFLETGQKSRQIPGLVKHGAGC